jgi:hypothetical protein
VEPVEPVPQERIGKKRKVEVRPSRVGGCPDRPPVPAVVVPPDPASPGSPLPGAAPRQFCSCGAGRACLLSPPGVARPSRVAGPPSLLRPWVLCVCEWDPWRLRPHCQPPGPRPPIPSLSSGVPLEGGGPRPGGPPAPSGPGNHVPWGRSAAAAAHQQQQQQQHQPCSSSSPPAAAAAAPTRCRGGVAGVRLLPGSQGPHGTVPCARSGET